MRTLLIIVLSVIAIGLVIFLSTRTNIVDATREKDLELIELMDILREDMKLQISPIEEQIKELVKKQESIKRDYSLRIDSFKKLLSREYIENCQSEDCQRNIRLSGYSSEANMSLMDHAEAKELNQPPMNFDDIGKIDKYLKANYTGLRHYAPLFIEFSKKYKIDSDFAVAVCMAETKCGKHMATANNFFNIGNTDGGNRVSYETVRQGVEAFFYTIASGTYQKHNYRIGDYSAGGKKVVGNNESKAYASSVLHWGENVKDVMKELKNAPIDEWYQVRVVDK